jgi:hypothetical protein
VDRSDETGLPCAECGHSHHGRSRCVKFVGSQEAVDVPELGRCVFMDSHPCNCMGPVSSCTDDVASDRMVVACTLFLNEKRLPC